MKPSSCTQRHASSSHLTGQHKLSGTCRSAAGATAYCRVRSDLSRCASWALRCSLRFEALDLGVLSLAFGAWKPFPWTPFHWGGATKGSIGHVVPGMVRGQMEMASSQL